MSKGFWGKILRVDLTSGRITIDERNENFYRTYLDGRGVIADYLLNEVPPGCDPLSPDNVLVFAASVLTGTAIPGAARVSIGAKSPLTGAYGEGEAGGYWGVKLRWAGYGGVIIAGRSERPVSYIPDESKVIYQSKDGKEEKVFDALEWPRRQAGCKHSRPCAHTFPTKENKWFVTMDITAMSSGVKGKNKARMDGYPVSWKRKGQPKNIERTGPD